MTKEKALNTDTAESSVMSHLDIVVRVHSIPFPVRNRMAPPRRSSSQVYF
jgi:hypothetical protein